MNVKIDVIYAIYYRLFKVYHCLSLQTLNPHRYPKRVISDVLCVFL